MQTKAKLLWGAPPEENLATILAYQVDANNLSEQERRNLGLPLVLFSGKHCAQLEMNEREVCRSRG